jgi:hypothetical protein
MSFCEKCSEKDAQYELLMKRYHQELQCCKLRIDELKTTNTRLQLQNDALILDIAFYDKKIVER